MRKSERERVRGGDAPYDGCIGDENTRASLTEQRSDRNLPETLRNSGKEKRKGRTKMRDRKRAGEGMRPGGEAIRALS